MLLQSDIEEIVELTTDIHPEFIGKRILITGGAGFLGQYFTQYFAKLNEELIKHASLPCEVIVLDNMITSHESVFENYSNDYGFSWVKHDIIQPFYPERPVDFILHAAGIASPFYYRKFPLETLEVATIGLKNTLELARKSPGCKLSFFSSSEIYGDPTTEEVPTREGYRGNVSCLGPRSCYDESKRLGETLVRIYHEKHQVHGTIIRPFNVFGPGLSKNDYRVLPNFGRQIMQLEPLTIYGTGNQTRTFCYVTDAINGFLRVLVNGESGEPYNIGNPSPEISMIDLAKLMGTILNKDVKFNLIDYPDTYPADEPNRRCPNITKSQVHVNYEPVVSLTDGLKRFLNWAHHHYD